MVIFCYFFILVIYIYIFYYFGGNWINTKIILQIVKDLLAVQISTIVYESIFSTSDSILDSFRSFFEYKYSWGDDLIFQYLNEVGNIEWLTKCYRYRIWFFYHFLLLIVSYHLIIVQKFTYYILYLWREWIMGYNCNCCAH